MFVVLLMFGISLNLTACRLLYGNVRHTPHPAVCADFQAVDFAVFQNGIGQIDQYQAFAFKGRLHGDAVHGYEAPF